MNSASRFLVESALIAWMFLGACAAFGQQSVPPSIAARRQHAAIHSTDKSSVKGQFILQRRRSLYTVHPTDTLDLTFPLTPEFNQKVTVQPDGFISLRGVGDLSVAGETLPELTASLKKAYSVILKGPMIYVNPTDYEKPYFIVTGKVAKPGKFEWRGQVTLTEAIAEAGGFTDAAKHSQVVLFRRISDEWAPGRVIDVKRMLNTRNLDEDPMVRPGDMIYVPQNRISKVKPFIPLPSVGMYANKF